MDQLLRLNEESLKWHVLCQLLSSSVLERLLKTLYEVCPTFNADTTIVAKLYHETEQACLDVVKNFILIGEANKLLQGPSSKSTSAPAAVTTPPAVPEALRKLAPKPEVKLENGDKAGWVNQINQNIQLQLKQLQSNNTTTTASSPGNATSSTVTAPASPPMSSPQPTVVSNGTPNPTVSTPTNPSVGTPNPTVSTPNPTVGTPSSQSPLPPPSFESPTKSTDENKCTENVTEAPKDTQKLEKQVSELKNYMDEVKALFDVFNDPSPRNKDAVTALSQALSANNAVAHELQVLIKSEPQQMYTQIPTTSFFPIQHLLEPEITIEPPQPQAPPPSLPAPTPTKRSSKEKLFCSDCGQTFQYSYQMERHIATRHSHIKKIICDICKKTFGSPGALKRHHETIHQKIKRFTCEDCGKKFGRKDHMKFHISTVHSQKKDQPPKQPTQQHHVVTPSLDQTLLDVALKSATAGKVIHQIGDKRKADDPLDELKQRIRDMSDNHARELTLQQQLQQQLHQQQLQQHILAQQQTTFDIQNVINSINQDILKTATSSPSSGTPPTAAPIVSSTTSHLQDESVDVTDDYHQTASQQFNSEVIMKDTPTLSPAHVTVT
eukprot:sb/3463152/